MFLVVAASFDNRVYAFICMHFNYGEQSCTLNFSEIAGAARCLALSRDVLRGFGMTTEPQDVRAALDAIEEDVELRRADPDLLLPRLATLLLSLQGDSRHRPRVHRLMGVVQNRLKLDRDALRELREAKRLAETASPPNYAELAKIGRETALVYAWRGDDQRAASELLPALAFASLEGDDREVAKIIAECGRLELDAQRFDNVVMLFRHLAAQGAKLELPPRELQRVRVNLCQALNRLGAHEEALRHTAALRADLPKNEAGLQFLTRLEEARAYGGLGRFDGAERVLLEAEALLPEKDSAFERSEFIQAVTELQEVKGGPPAVKSLEHLIEEYAEQHLVVREAVARRALANALFKLGEADRARDVLSQGLRNALHDNLVDVADEIRADMLKSAGAEHLEELAEAIDVIGGGSALDQRFIRMKRLGKGGAGEVCRAIDLNDGRNVALKRIELRDASEDRRRGIINTIKTEYAAAGKLDDPRFARVLDLRMVPDGALYVVQRFVSGPTLRELYASGAQPDRLLGLLAGVADALIALHGKGILHRDLKPENVIVVRDKQGREWPVLIDLGIALVAGRPDELKHFGTPPYVAPEQAAGKAVDARADIYALGQMIAEIWGGKLPSHRAFGRLWHKEMPDEMPRTISDLVRGMVVEDPAHRTKDLTQVAEALRAQQRQMAGA
jgi:tetratricopeptide (TPR) repeat protein